jgi:hypothetical protein
LEGEKGSEFAIFLDDKFYKLGKKTPKCPYFEGKKGSEIAIY